MTRTSLLMPTPPIAEEVPFVEPPQDEPPRRAIPATASAATELEYAGFWKRFGAFFFDALLILTTLSWVTLVLEAIRIGMSDILYSVGVRLGIVAVIFLYFVVCESILGGATLGKMIMGIRVADASGNPPSFLRSFVRTFLKILSTIVLFGGFVMIAFTENKQALHDSMTKCFVVRYRKPYLVRALIVTVVVFSVFLGGAKVFGYSLTEMARGFAVNSIKFAGVDVSGGNGGANGIPGGGEQTSSQGEAVPPGTGTGATGEGGSASSVELQGGGLPKPPEQQFVDTSNPILVQYDSLLQQKVSPIEGTGSMSATIGPVALRLSAGPPSASKTPVVRIGLQVKTIKLPPNSLMKVSIDHIWVGTGADAFDHERMTQELFKLIELTNRDSFATGFYPNIFLSSPVKEDDIQKIEGKAGILIPLDVKDVSFADTEINTTKESEGLRVTLQRVEKDVAHNILSVSVLLPEGMEGRYLRTLGFDEQNRIIPGSTRGFVYDGNGGVSISTDFRGDVKTIKVIVASSFFSKEFPFSMEKK